MAPAHNVGKAFFPLDEQLGLGSAGLSPRGEETLVRLCIWMPFEQAAELLADLVGIRVSKATARRATLNNAQIGLRLDEAEQERLQQELPQAPAGADKQQLSADGAMVHLVGGEWVEIKTLALGEVARNKRGEVCTQHLSYFSRLAEATSFEQAALVETHRRGLEGAKEVCAVQDGALWLQGLVDYHRADAVRILDFAHASEYLNEIGQEVRAQGGHLPQWWLQGALHRLKHEGPSRVLRHLRGVAAHFPSATIQSHLAYLEKREGQMQDPSYQAAGWPIGSGSVESANKLVVGARLKGAGMRWQEQNVNPMLVLRNAVCNRRWSQTWKQVQAKLRSQRSQRREAKSQQRLASVLWSLMYWQVRLERLGRPPVAAASSPAVEAAAQPTVRRVSPGYSWRKPFLRRPSSPSTSSPLVGAKK